MKEIFTPLVNPETSAYVGFVWPVEGNHGSYDVTLGQNGWRCDCMGFKRAKSGACKHVVKIDTLVGGDHEDPVYRIPNV